MKASVDKWGNSLGIRIPSSIVKQSKLKKGTKVFKAVGCESCNNSGYQGRIGIFELFLITEEIKEAINRGETENKLSEIAFSNQNKLSNSGYDLVYEGVTSLDEILRVTSEK